MLMFFPLMLLASLAHAEAQELQSEVRVQAEAPQSEIVVRGKKVAWRAVLGSRLPRVIEPDPRGFVSQVASETGVAGLTPQSGMDPFAGGTRKVTVKTCKGSDSRMTLVALCDLALAQKGILDRDFGLARGAIDRVLTDPKSGQADKFFAHRFAFQIATLERATPKTRVMRWRACSHRAFCHSRTGSLLERPSPQWRSPAVTMRLP